MSRSRPIFVLCTARSGSTLLRVLLDAHPEIACPPETNICNVVETIHGAADACVSADQDPIAFARRLSRQVARATLGSYAAATGKSRWCDKSLPSADRAELLADVFPDAQFICLYRECADTVASLHEACEWGYGAFGVEPYARSYPHSAALALCSYWIDKTSAIHQFERASENRSHRVRYEDLVDRPEQTLRSLFDFLGVEWSDRYANAADALQGVRGKMPGDFKIRYTTRIHGDSVGRGWRVPVETLPPELIARINALAGELGYPPLRSDIRETWAASESNPLHVAAVTQLFATRVPERLAAGAHRAQASDVTDSMKVVLSEDIGPWVIDFGSSKLKPADTPAEWTALTDSETLLSLADGSCNPGLALRRSTLRLASGGTEPPEAFFRRVDALVALLAD